MAEQQDQIVEFLTKLYSQDPLGTLNSVIKALDKCQVDLVSRAQRMFGAVEQGNATTMTNIGIRYHRMAIKVTTALPIIPDNYQQTLNERIVELASPAAMSIPNTSGHLLRANATDELAPAFTRVNNKADTRRFACTFYNSLTAYFQSLVYHSLPQQVAYEIMTAAGFSRTNFMPTVARGDILQQVIQSFGPSALLVSEVFPFLVVSGSKGIARNKKSRFKSW
ncbi:hypothetical protein MBANPS3_012361 [Mucor bainieri]